MPKFTGHPQPLVGVGGEGAVLIAGDLEIADDRDRRPSEHDVGDQHDEHRRGLDVRVEAPGREAEHQHQRDCAAQPGGELCMYEGILSFVTDIC